MSYRFKNRIGGFAYKGTTCVSNNLFILRADKVFFVPIDNGNLQDLSRTQAVDHDRVTGPDRLPRRYRQLAERIEGFAWFHRMNVEKVSPAIVTRLEGTFGRLLCLQHRSGNQNKNPKTTVFFSYASSLLPQI